MLRTWFVVGTAVSLIGVISAQAPAPLVPITSVKDGASPEARKTSDLERAGQLTGEDFSYVIEMRVLEGMGLFEDGSAKRNAANLPRRAKAGRANTAPPAATAVLPQPSPPPSATRSAEAAAKSPEEELWDDSLRKPNITVLAAPKVTLDPKQPATVQMQTEQVFSYLVPLGNGKFEVKHSAVQELGMTFTLQVQPVDGDDGFVEVAPLEIHVSSLDGREPVEGLDLDVGKPIVATRSLKTTANMKLGATRIIAIPSGPTTQAALLLRVNRLKQQEE